MAVTRYVNAIYKAVDNSSKTLRGIGRAAGSASKASKGLIEQLGHVGHAMNTVRMVGGTAFTAIKHAVVDLNTKLESTTLAVAGTLKAYKLVDTFEDAEKAATQAFRQIRKDAAALPGEAEDYIKVFRTGLPMLIRSQLGGLKEMTNFTNKYTASMIANQVDAVQSGRDLTRMLAGRAGRLVKSWTVLKPFIKQTQKQFNSMTTPERAKVLQEAIQRYEPMLDKFSNTMDAQQGTITSFVKDFTMAATKPMFEKAKVSLGAINDFLGKNQKMIENILGNLGNELVRVLDTAGKAAMGLWVYFKKAWGVMKQMANSPLVQAIKGGVSSIISSTSNERGGGANAAGVTGGVVASIMGIPGAAQIAVVISALLKFGEHTEAVNAVWSSLQEAGMHLVTMLRPLMLLFDSISTLLSEVFVVVLPPIADVFNRVAETLSFVFGIFSAIIVDMVNTVGPTVVKIYEALAKLVKGVTDFLAPVIRFVAILLMGVWQILKVSIVPIFTTFYEAIAWFIGKLGDLLSWLGKGLDKVVPKGVGPTAKAKDSGGPSFFDRMMKASVKQKEAAEIQINQVKLAGATGKGKGKKTVNDFRGSKFDIKQDFADLDPERVAVAFSNDLAKLAEHAVQSGFSPAFSGR